jgi:hypothetical protein
MLISELIFRRGPDSILLEYCIKLIMYSEMETMPPESPFIRTGDDLLPFDIFVVAISMTDRYVDG